MTRFLFSLFILAATAPAAEDTYQPRDTQAPGEQPPTPEEAAKAITLPEGFHATLFAGEPDVRQPVAMAFDDRGRLFVAESYSYKEWERKGEDRVLIFEDTDNDGRHDKRTVFYTGLNHLSGLTVGWGGVWVCDSPNLLFIPDRDRDDVPDGEPEVVLDGWTIKGGHNFFNGLTWGIDGWLYGRHGITAPSKVGTPGTPDAERPEFDCSIWRYHPVTKRFEVVCRGTTNPWGLDWNADGEMFFTNNVNGHLWHAISGAYYPRMGNRDDPFARAIYDRIGLCADHLHHAGTTDDWTKTRDGKGVHGELGGGHSHCGEMIYLGGKWPAEYAGKVFMCNTHGRRLNVDRLERSGSGYVARHEADFMMANNPWFRGVQVIYGPDGDVFVSDWTDLGECHDNDGVHRSSGRIYKIVYGAPSPKPKTDLQDASDEELIGHQLHENEWYARAARLVLQQRAAEGKLASREAMTETLRKVFAVHPDHATRLRLILTLHVCGALPPSALNELVHDEDEHIRAWAVRLCNEENYEGDTTVQVAVNTDDPSRLVRLAWASMLQSANFSHVAWRVAGQLARDPSAADDHNLPLMIWYGVKDRVAGAPDQAVALMSETKIPVLQTYLARRLAEEGLFSPLMTWLDAHAADSAACERALAGVADGIGGRSDLAAPPEWTGLAKKLATTDSLRLLVTRLDFAFDPDGARPALEKSLGSGSGASVEEKRLALELLAASPKPDLHRVIVPLLEDDALRADAVAALGRLSDPEGADALIAKYAETDATVQPAIVNALSGKPRFAFKLLDAVESGAIPRHAVTAYHARQIRTYKDETLRKRLAAVWGSFSQSSGEKAETIKHWQSQLTADVLAKADVAKGHEKFQQLCMACHTLKGEGGRIGPDLTGANRSDAYYLLENIIDPSATLPQDFRLTVITRGDGSVVSGNIRSENEYAIGLHTLAGEESIDVTDIAKRETLEQSIMPEGLLAPLQPDEVRDLIGFLMR